MHVYSVCVTERQDAEILLWCTADALHVTENDDIRKYLSENNVNEHLFKSFQIRNVPASRPLTKPQFALAQCHWPVLFHEDKKYYFI